MVRWMKALDRGDQSDRIKELEKEIDFLEEVTMRMRRLTLLTITMAVSVAVLGGIAQAADNQAGTWRLNVAKSKYSPGPAPKEGTLTIESQADGLKFTIHGTDAEGKAVHMEFSPKYDGKDYPATGMSGADTIGKVPGWRPMLESNPPGQLRRQ